MEYTKERTAGNLRAIRNLRKYSQAELAELSGVSRDSIKLYEMGETTMSLENATKLASALECSLDSLVDEMRV